MANPCLIMKLFLYLLMKTNSFWKSLVFVNFFIWRQCCEFPENQPKFKLTEKDRSGGDKKQFFESNKREQTEVHLHGHLNFKVFTLWKSSQIWMKILQWGPAETSWPAQILKRSDVVWMRHMTSVIQLHSLFSVHFLAVQ